MQLSPVPHDLTSIKAIRHSVDEWNVDIISLSLNVKGDSDDLRVLAEAVEYASQKALIFCSAGNQLALGTSQVAFPASLTSHVFSIYAHGANAQPLSDYNPRAQPGDCNFTVIGDMLRCRRSRQENPLPKT